jgi:glutamate racemase
MTQATGDTRPIAMLDSGVGGLSILREVRRALPHEDILYFADQVHVPYGPRPLAEIQGLAKGIVRFFLARQAKTVVVACNAASAASLHYLRAAFPGVPFVGMEPAVKPAAEQTQSGVIGVVTTEATFQGELFASVVGRFAQGKEVLTQVCPEFVTLVEQGSVEGTPAREIVRARLEPLLAKGIDHLVLGCTHFPFLEKLIAEEVGPGVRLVDPSPAVARQVSRVVGGARNGQSSSGHVTHYTTGEVAAYTKLVTLLLGEEPGDVRQALWQEGRLSERV